MREKPRGLKEAGHSVICFGTFHVLQNICRRSEDASSHFPTKVEFQEQFLCVLRAFSIAVAFTAMK